MLAERTPSLKLSLAQNDTPCTECTSNSNDARSTVNSFAIPTGITPSLLCDISKREPPRAILEKMT
jgi:hypothetical protein